MCNHGIQEYKTCILFSNKWADSHPNSPSDRVSPVFIVHLTPPHPIPHILFGTWTPPKLVSGSYLNCVNAHSSESQMLLDPAVPLWAVLGKASFGTPADLLHSLHPPLPFLTLTHCSLINLFWMSIEDSFPKKRTYLATASLLSYCFVVVSF